MDHERAEAREAGSGGGQRSARSELAAQREREPAVPKSIRAVWPEARAAQSRYLWMCTEERARRAPAVERRRVV